MSYLVVVSAVLEFELRSLNSTSISQVYLTRPALGVAACLVLLQMARSDNGLGRPGDHLAEQGSTVPLVVKLYSPRPLVDSLLLTMPFAGVDISGCPGELSRYQVPRPYAPLPSSTALDAEYLILRKWKYLH